MVFTQLPLKYNRLFLGHKKGSKDRPLRGEADYILDVDGRLRWVIEAKKPGPITDDDREQAYSYAMHPEVRAILFAVMTGTHFEVFHTFDKPEKGPILAWKAEDTSDYFQRLFNVVSPDALRLSYPEFVNDVGPPLAPGLRSFANVESGTLAYTNLPDFMPKMEGFVVHINKGSIIRNYERGIVALITPSFHDRSLTEFAKAIQATELDLTSTDEAISTDPLNPTVFVQERDIRVAEGTPVPTLTSFNTNVPAITHVSSRVRIEVSSYLREKQFLGKLVAQILVAGIPEPFFVRGDIALILR